MLVATGAALFTIVSAFGFADVLRSGGSVLTRLDPSRIAAQIVSGIGFLGAGAIIRQGLAVRGLTTAASLWIVAAIGMASGAGMYAAAAIATALVLFLLGPLRRYAFRLVERFRPEETRLVVEVRKETSAAELLAEIHGRGYAVRAFELEEEAERRVMTFHLDKGVADLVPALSDVPYVTAVRWQR
jgi:putative Mg2+ transporter-C (MgtC) family protein